MTRHAARRVGLPLEGARLAVQGFGNVGQPLAEFLRADGCQVVALSDSRGAIYREGGLEPAKVARYKQETGSVVGFPGSQSISHEELLEVDCEILAPCALANEITGRNADRVKARIVVEGANGPTTPVADRILADRGALVVPDVLANAGGVTVSYFEWVQDLMAFFWEPQEINARLEQIMTRAFTAVVAEAENHRVDLRTAAQMLAVRRVADALKLRGIFP